MLPGKTPFLTEVKSRAYAAIAGDLNLSAQYFVL